MPTISFEKSSDRDTQRLCQRDRFVIKYRPCSCLDLDYLGAREANAILRYATAQILVGQLQVSASLSHGSSGDIPGSWWSFALQCVPVRHTDLSVFGSPKGACGAHRQFYASPLLA